MNARYALVTIGNKVRIMCHKVSEHGKPDFDLLTKSDFETTVCNLPSPVQRKSRAKWWLEHSDRLDYKGIIFEPNHQSPDYYNLWQGFSVAAVPGNCLRFKDFMLDVICNGNQAAFAYLWQWCAFMVQYPEKMPGVAIVLMGGQGIGKNTFVDALGHLVGDHYFPAPRMEQITGRFNSHMKNTLLLYANEAMWGGRRSDAGALKALITDDTLPVEFKGKDIFKMSNHIHLIISSNEDWPVPIDADDRRFFVLDVSPAHKQDHQYFGLLRGELENGGYEALLHDLKDTDLSHFNPMVKPNTSQGVTLKLRSFESEMKWLFECLQLGCFVPSPYTHHSPGLPNHAWPDHCQKADLHNEYMDWCRRHNDRHPIALTELMKKLKRTIPSLVLDAKVSVESRVTRQLNRKRVVKIPSLEICRAEFEHSMDAVGLIDWPPSMSEDEVKMVGAQS